LLIDPPNVRATNRCAGIVTAWASQVTIGAMTRLLAERRDVAPSTSISFMQIMANNVLRASLIDQYLQFVFNFRVIAFRRNR
jgi:hypothetical protein